MGIQIGTTDISNIFLGGPVDNPRLPSAYQEVEYLESSGTQFIETDVNSLTAPFKVEVKYMKQNTDTSDQTLVGQRQLGKFVNIYNNYYENLWSNTASGSASGDNNIHTIVTDSSAGLYKDGTLLMSGTSGNRSSSYNALIFAFSEDSAANAKWFLKGRIYEVKITNNGALYRHYIPCYRKSDNVIGMYELVAGTFKTNAGSGTFAKGSNVDTNVYQKFKEVYVGTCKVRPIIRDANLEFLLVGGGGGGGGGCVWANAYYCYGAGGGGAGGVVHCDNITLQPGSYSVVIGSGGNGGTTTGCKYYGYWQTKSVMMGCKGGNSCFGDIVAYGGGGGNSDGNCDYTCMKEIMNGGSGGGASGMYYTTYGIGCRPQGNNGGRSNCCCCCQGGGGGGGYCCPGCPGCRSAVGAGGCGYNSSISGQSVWYGSGGYGSGVGILCPGVCGGGSSCGGAKGNATTYGSGGGGGRADNSMSCLCDSYGGAGKQGVFIVRYPTACGYNITGGTKYTCGNYTIHCFTSNGTLTVN